jgi:hypothetical protein
MRACPGGMPCTHCNLLSHNTPCHAEAVHVGSSAAAQHAMLRPSSCCLQTPPAKVWRHNKVSKRQPLQGLSSAHATAQLEQPGPAVCIQQRLHAERDATISSCLQCLIHHCNVKQPAGLRPRVFPRCKQGPRCQHPAGRMSQTTAVKRPSA